VDFPLPEAPRMATVSPGWRFKSRPLSTSIRVSACA